MTRALPCLAAALALLLLLAGAARSHELRPALLQLNEVEPDHFEVVWRVPARGDLVLSLTPRFPEGCSETAMPETRQTGSLTERRSRLYCADGLGGKVIAIAGLLRLRTDVLVQVTYLNGGSETLRARPEAPSVVLAGRQSLAQVAGAYFLLGGEHILLGIDHLLFVFILLLLVRGWKRLVATITAFTLAHSLTLAAATLGFASAPASLIEPLIALSIVFVAAEVIHLQQGRASMTSNLPWLVAFVFGLLHGFGFAGALHEVGLPEEAIPVALLFFNLGVEAGQLLFIGLLAVLALLSGRFLAGRERALAATAASCVGIVAGFWTVERVAAIWL